MEGKKHIGFAYIIDRLIELGWAFTIVEFKRNKNYDFSTMVFKDLVIDIKNVLHNRIYKLINNICQPSYYETVIKTQHSAEILRSELKDLLDSIREVQQLIKTQDKK